MNHPPSFPVLDIPFRGERVRVERLARGVHRLVLARPGRRNAFDGAMIAELSACLEQLAGPPPEELRVLLLAGDGEVFCAGADLACMRAMGTASLEENLEDARRLGSLFRRLAAFPAPVVALVQGAALGGGLGLAACADLVLAEAGAVFGTTEVRLGILPAVIAPYLLRRLGLAQAAPLMLAGIRIGAAEGRRIGLVHRVVEGSEAWPGVLAAALQDCLAAGPEAARRTKALLLELSPLPAPGMVELTAQAIARARVSPEGQAGLGAFLDKALAPWAAERP